MEDYKRLKHNKGSLDSYYRHREEILAKKRAEYQEKKGKILEANRKWKEENPDYMKKYKEKNKEKTSAYNKAYAKTKNGRANNLRRSYCNNDKKHNRGECTLTNKWIVDNIFSSKCVYCGESDWKKLGCDRKDNNLPHTPDNVVPCCLSCNSKKGSMNYEDYMKTLNLS